MKTRWVVTTTAVTLVLAGHSAGGSNAATVDGAGEPITLNLALDQDMATLLPMDSNIDNNIWVLDVVYDGLVRYDPETTEPYPYVAESIETTDNQVWTITSSRT